MNVKLDVTLPAKTVATIEEQVALGRFASADDLLQQAVEALMTQDASGSEPDLDYMRMRTKQSVDDPRPSVPLDEGIARLRTRLADLYKQD